MRKTLLLMLTFVASLATFAQTNLTSGKTVVPLGGLKSYNNGTTDYTISNEDLQKITQDGNTANVYLFPEGGYDTEANRATGIQGFYIDMGASKSVGVIKSTWEGADAGGNIYVTNTEPAADGTLTGETLIATFTNAQEAAKDVPAQVDNSGRYIVFVPTEATNYAWGVKIRTFAAFEKEASVLTTLEVTPAVVKVGEATEMTFTAKDQVGIALTEGVTYTATGATLEGTTLTAAAAGDVTITATYNGVSVSKTITAVSVSAPTANPDEPTDLAANVIAVYSAKYGKGLVDNNPAWGIGGGAPNPLYSSLEEVEIADGHKVVHVTGTGFNNRTAGGVGITTDYDKIHVALYPFTATEAKIFGDNAYGNAISVNGLVPGQWNYVEVDNPGNQPNYMLVELVGEQEFYLDHFYFSKPAMDDDEAPVLETPVVKSVSPVSITLTLKATDNKSPKITYVVTDQDDNTYTTTGDNGVAVDFVVSPLQSSTAYTLSIVAKDNNENVTAAQTVNATTTALTAAPVPTQDADKVLSIYSDTYTAATTYNYGNWGQTTVVDTETIDGNEALKLSSYNYLGFELQTQLDLSDMDYIHIDVLPLQPMDLGITPVMNGGTPTELPTSVGTLTVGEWNSKDIKLSDLGLDYENAKAFQLKIDKGTGTDVVFVDNIYFWKDESGDEPGAIVINAPDAQDIVKVTGTITDENKGTVEALTDAMIDLSGATIEATELEITGNPNAVIVVAGTVGEGNAATTTQTTVKGNRVVKRADGYYFPVYQLQFVDNPQHGLWTGFFISGNAAGWKYTRTLKANTYNTVVVPVGTDVPAGATAYQLSAYADGTVTFDKIEGAMAAGQPYLVKVDGADVDIEIEFTGDFDIRDVKEQATEANGATFQANYKKQTKSDVYVLKSGTTEASFYKAADANIGSCRAYLTGVAASSGAPEVTVVLNGDDDISTHVGTIKANGEITDAEVYNLNGQRVQNPKKGLYIVNGRKVVIK